MTDKITSLTQEQTDSIPVFCEKWIDIGLSTAPVNRADCIEAINLAYKCSKMKLPTYFVFLDGPTQGNIAANYADEIYALLEKDEFDYENSWKVIDSFPKKKISFENPAVYGSQDAGWLSFYDYFNHHFNLAEAAKGLFAVAQTCGWVWMYEDLVIVTSRPTKISMRNKLSHCETGPAIEYADGTKIFSYDGITIPEKWVMEKNTIDPGEILSCTDTDKRAKGIALIGYQRMKHDLNYKIIDGDPTTDIGALIELTIPGLPRPGRFLEAICPRNGSVFLGIPQKNPVDDKDIKTAVGAQAFLARLSEKDYQHPPIRT